MFKKLAGIATQGGVENEELTRILDVREPSNLRRDLQKFHTPAGLRDLLTRDKQASEFICQHSGLFNQLAEVRELVGSEYMH